VREYFYDADGRMTQLREPDGGILLFDNQADGLRNKKYDALGYATTYSYRLDRAFTGTSDANGNVTRVQDALNRTVDLSYGPLDQVATVKDKRGTTTTTTFATSTFGCDYTNRPKETRISTLSGLSNVLLASLCWNGNATLNYSRSYLDASRYHETRLSYTDNGLNVSREDLVGMPSGVTITRTYTWDSLGRKKTETLKRRASPTNAAPIDLTTTYEYDALDRIVKLTDPLGNEVINHYDANGMLWKVTHRYKNGASYDVRDVITRTFDAADRVKTETDAEGNVTTYSYDEAGNVIAVTDAEGHTTRYEYDALNRKTAAIDATGYRSETRYNQRGEVVAVSNANGETTRFEYDALGRKTAQVDPLGYRTEYQYDANGNLTCLIDANAQAGLQPKNSFGCTESRQYDELNRVTKIVDALNGETSFTYDLLGNRLTVKDAENKTWRFAYDDLGRLASETDHGGKTIAYQRDEAGNVWEKTNRLGEITRFTFDAGNRLTRIDYLKDGTAETYSYDAAGNRTAAANGTVSYSFTWDRLNRLTAKTDSRGRSLSFTYDRVGNILTKTPYQGSTTRYVYNAANRLVMLRNPDYTQVDYQYDPAGRLLSRVTANGARLTQQFDANGWLTQLNQFDAANNLVSSTSYTRDRIGHILTQTEGGGSTSYTYDALYRLTQANYPGTANDELFTYDKVGNRKTYTKGSLTPNANTRYYNYTAGSNRLAEVRIGSAAGTLESSFTNDFEGRLTAQTGVGAKTLTWDAKGRLWTLSRAGAGTETYRYDPMDYRIGRSGGSLGSRDYFLEGEHLESEYAGGTLQAKYFRGVGTDELVAAWLVDTDGKLKPYLFHHDPLTSVSAVTGHNGGTTQSIKYSAFGQVQSSTGASPNRLKYTGREDDGTGLYYYRARYYDPQIGRFVSEDPIGFASGDMSFYAYVGNNPVNANDPMGLEPYTPYSSYKDAQIAAARYNAELTLGQMQYHGTTQEFGSRVYQVGNSYYHTPAVTTSGKANEVSEAAWVATLSMIPDNSGRGRSHSHPPLPGWLQTPSKEDWSGASALGDTIGRVDGSVFLYKKTDKVYDPATGGIRQGGGSVIAPQMQLTPRDPEFEWAPVSDFPASPGGTNASPANGGFLLYPNKSNTNMMQSVYGK
jgi:RHS repeat-associated protein